jgi:hypothetical protein
METNFPNYLTKAMLSHLVMLLKLFLTVLESRDAEAKPGQGQLRQESC